MPSKLPFPLEGRDLESITDDELVDAWERQDALKGGPDRSFFADDAHVARITSTSILKIDLSIEAEVSNMEEVRKKSPMRVPRLYRTFSHEGSGYIFMEYIDGQRLDHVEWEARTERSRQHIKTELKTAFIALSKLRSTVPGPVKNIAQGRLFSVYGANTTFSSVHELEEWFTAKLFGEGSLLGAFDPDQLVMCHMDLNMRNLILDKDGGRLFFLDWAYSGYYPPECQEALFLYDRRPHLLKCAWSQDLPEVYREVYGSGKDEVVAKLVRVLEFNSGPRGASHLLNGEQGLGPG
jgi:serine/threonine protein kinase